ncbi:TPA: hypothetical protein HA265_03775 [Candidatus Woesearchaeota archaeon]|nr:hypothetical protein [Candidatus Woesearchaeota archaeon]
MDKVLAFLSAMHRKTEDVRMRRDKHRIYRSTVLGIAFKYHARSDEDHLIKIISYMDMGDLARFPGYEMAGLDCLVNSQEGAWKLIRAVDRHPAEILIGLDRTKNYVLKYCGCFVFCHKTPLGPFWRPSVYKFCDV